jgi:DNA polymerase-3 subunit gamma/tau
MLTKEAANALLKTLEEPPSHVVFILATTDPDKLPQTIVSRCQKVIFKQPDIETLAARLMHVVEQETKSITKDTAELIARHGKGSYRDALGILEQILTVSGKTIKHDDVASSLGTPEKETLLQLLGALCVKNPKDILTAVSALRSTNSQALRTYDELLELVRQGLLTRIGEKDATDPELKRLATEYPHTVASKTILELLKQRHLLEVSDTHAWTAFEAILLNTVEL